jgi:hypothetical protein
MHHALFFNLLLGLLPALILGASWAAGIADDRQHRLMFLFVYGLWALTLAMWNWMRSAHVAWIALWSAAGVVSLILVALLRRRPTEN